MESPLTSAIRLLESGRLEEARSKLEALIAESGLSRSDELECRFQLGIFAWAKDDKATSASRLREALDLASSLGHRARVEACKTLLEAQSVFARAIEERDRGEVEKSNAGFRKALDLANEAESPVHGLKILRTWGANYASRVADRAYLEISRQALDLALSSGNKGEIQKAYNNIGGHFEANRDHSHALNSYFKALRLARETGDLRSQANTLNNIAGCYASIGDSGKALDYISEAEGVPGVKGSPLRAVISLLNFAQIAHARFRASGSEADLAAALDAFARGTNTAETIADRNLVLTAGLGLSAAQIDFGRFREARANLARIRREARREDELALRGAAILRLGLIEFRLGETAAAEADFRTALAESRLAANPGLQARAAYLLARCLETRRDPSGALALYEEALDLLDEVGSRIMDDAQRAEYLFSRREIYQALVDFCYRKNKARRSDAFEAELFRGLERIKARSFIEFLERQRALPAPAAADPEARSRLGALRADRLGLLRRLSEADLDEAAAGKLEAAVRGLDDQIEAALAEPRLRDGGPAVPGEPVSLKALRESVLDPEAALIEYFLGDERSYAILVSRSSVRIEELPAAKVLRDSVTAFLSFLADPRLPAGQGVPPARRIYAELLAPLVDALPPGIRHLVIVPDGVLYGLPFEALSPPGSGEAGEGAAGLLGRWTVSYAPSATALTDLERRPRADAHPKDLLAVGNPAYPRVRLFPQARDAWSPGMILADFYQRRGFAMPALPGAEKETRSLARRFARDRRDVLIGKEASEERLKALDLRDYRIVHFAGHALSDDDNPPRSALVLSLTDSPTGEDGFLQVSEMRDMRMSADLVVLSACQSGSGKILRNEGQLGLPRVFFYMGARSVISSLWTVHDASAAAFMGHFYDAYASGRGPAEALRQAKLRMIASDYAHPYYWAGFVLTGGFGLNPRGS